MHDDRLVDHWWQRPGRPPGRHVLTWHLTFENALQLHRAAEAYQSALAELPLLRPVPPRWLHVTLQAVGFADEVEEGTAEELIDAVRKQLSALPAFTVHFGRPVVHREAATLKVEPAAPVADVLDAVRAGVETVLGPLPERTRPFHPHVSIAYSGGEGESAPYVEALAAVDPGPVEVEITQVSLIRQERLLDPHWFYRWDTVAVAALQG
ncbi:2'-5' RNA ligase family protein [Pseudonocardia sp. TRM90224]|uniref:2'-5' RNA ligase family protein n=1 Tax=Pseudonocardia sp. TRM90224 TaxID=2812678 RepID=UPI001E2CEDF4|nr:2'-5' RNA ligase family protein [Pseudonocardia sp. TRM90224]